MDRVLVDAGAGAARRGRLGHRSDRRRRARRRDRRSLPPARRDGHRDEPLRRAQDLRVDDRRRGQRGVRLRRRHVRADLSAVYGSPGRSLALEIAGAARAEPVGRRRARARTSARARRSSPSTWRRSIATCARSSTSSGSPRASARRCEAAEARMRQREDALRQREETFRRRLNEELDTQVRQARREIDDVIAELKAKTAAIAQEAPAPCVTTGDTGAVRGDARAAVDHVASACSTGRRRRPRRPSASPPTGERDAQLEVGDRVIVGGLGLEGVVTGAPRRHGGSRRARQADARQRARSARRRRAARSPAHGARQRATSSCSRARRRRRI